MKKVALRKQKSPSCHLIDKQRKNATGDGDSTEVRIVTEDHESASTQLQKDGTTLTDKAIESAFWNEDATIASNK